MINFNNNNISEVYVGNIRMVSGYTDGSWIFPTSTPPVPPTPTSSDYLNFTARNGSATIGTRYFGSPDMKYSFDKITWTQWNYSSITLNENQTIWFKGYNPHGFNTDYNIQSNNRTFTVTGTVEANGSVQSLLWDDDFENNLTIIEHCFYELFADCSGLTTAPTLPATTAVYGCYEKMFSGCTSLTTAPTLPATTLVTYCYRDMFRGCTSLTTAPQLNATTMVDNCYMNMFYGCTSLTTAPQLPSTTLSFRCYYGMFEGCTSLTTAPQLLATILESDSYGRMFYGCTNLNYIKAMFTTDPSTYDYTDNWVNGVASSGTFVKNSSATWNVVGNNGVPNGWTIEYASE